MLNGDKKHYPNIYTRMFVDTLSQFGSMIEIRTGWGTQNLPVFVRMLDKDSEWCIENNGLHSLITTLLQVHLFLNFYLKIFSLYKIVSQSLTDEYEWLSICLT